MPVLIWAVFCGIRQSFDRSDAYRFEWKIILAIFGLQILFNSSMMQFWSGGFVWGPRYLIPVIPFLIIPMAYHFNKKWSSSIIIITGLFSILINWTGVQYILPQNALGAVPMFFISSALFLCVGVLYDRIHSRDIASYGGLVHRMPAYALVFMVFTLGALGLPGTSGFIGEFLSLLAAYQVNRLLAVLASTGMVLGAVYMLWLYRRVMLGLLEKEELKSILDLNRREVAVFAPLVVLVLWMGIYPEYFLGFMHASAENLVDKFKIAHALNLAAAAP